MKTDLNEAAKTMKATNFFISENLTLTSRTISYVLRRTRKNFAQIICRSTTFHGINYVWVQNTYGNAATARNIRHKTSAYTALASFCSQTLNQPLDHCVPDRKHWLLHHRTNVINSPAVLDGTNTTLLFNILLTSRQPKSIHLLTCFFWSFIMKLVNCCPQLLYLLWRPAKLPYLFVLVSRNNCAPAPVLVCMQQPKQLRSSKSLNSASSALKTTRTLTYFASLNVVLANSHPPSRDISYQSGWDLTTSSYGLLFFYYRCCPSIRKS